MMANMHDFVGYWQNFTLMLTDMIKLIKSKCYCN